MKMPMTYIGDKVTDTANTVTVWVQLEVRGKKTSKIFSHQSLQTSWILFTDPLKIQERKLKILALDLCKQDRLMI